MAKNKTAKVVTKSKSPRAIAVSEDKKWRARDDLRTIQSAQEIAADKSRFKAAQQEAKAQIQALSKVKAN